VKRLPSGFCCVLSTLILSFFSSKSLFLLSLFCHFIGLPGDDNDDDNDDDDNDDNDDDGVD